MTEDQAIRAGTLSVLRKDVRRANAERGGATLTVTINGKNSSIPLDTHSLSAVLNALDLSLSNRLGKLGVAEV